MVGSVSSANTSQVIQLNQLDRQLNGQVSQRAEQQRERSAATLENLLNNTIENRQQSIRSSTQGMKGTRVDTFA